MGHVQVFDLDTAGTRVHVKVKKQKPHGGIVHIHTVIYGVLKRVEGQRQRFLHKTIDQNRLIPSR